MTILEESKPGFYLSGLPLTPAGDWRKRPFGHKALVIEYGKYTKIEYVYDQAHERAEPKQK